MKNYLKPIIAAILVLCAIMLSAWTLNWDSIKKNMSDVKSISGSFVQKKNVKILTKPLISTGRLYYQSPDSIRWEYISPVKSILLVNKGKVKRYMFKDGAFIEDSSVRLEAVRIVVSQITEWFSGNFNESKDFKAEIKEGKVVLVPVNQTIGSFIKKVVVTFSKNEGVISAIEIVESQGSSTYLEFGDIAINKSLPPWIFEKVK